jgi:DNA-binding winged helix-turn-helix (wHTH) protein
MQQVWGDADITEVSLARTVHGLRRRFIENGQSKDLIRNVYSEGYIFTANVTPTTEAFAVAAPAA